MKKLTLKAVMNSLSIITHKDGYELISVAGRARYDAWGVRKFLFGIPEYFPVTISVAGGDSTAPNTSENHLGKSDSSHHDDLLAMHEAAADTLDDLTERWKRVNGGHSTAGKIPVFLLSGRYAVIGGGYTPEEICTAVDHIKAIRASAELSKDEKAASPVTIKNGGVFIDDAVIGDGIATANWSMKVNAGENGEQYAARMGVAVEDGKEQVAFKAEKFEVNKSDTLQLNNAIATAAEFKIRLSDEMRDAVIDAIRESDVFKALLSSQDAQASALVTTQQAIEQAATDAIRNALKSGGLLFGKR